MPKASGLAAVATDYSAVCETGPALATLRHNTAAASIHAARRNGVTVR
jgi:hypothetical protein